MPTVVTHVNDALFATIKMGALQERWVAAADGKKLHGLVVTPPDFDAHKKYPALFVVHGGPEGAWGDDWSYRWNPQAFAAQAMSCITTRAARRDTAKNSCAAFCRTGAAKCSTT